MDQSKVLDEAARAFCQGIAADIDQTLENEGYSNEFRNRARMISLAFASDFWNNARSKESLAGDGKERAQARIWALLQVKLEFADEAIQSLETELNGQEGQVRHRIITGHYQLQPDEQRTPADVARRILSDLSRP